MTHKVLIIGLGNPILGDDGAGWHTAREVTRQFLARHFLLQDYPAHLEQTQWPCDWILWSDDEYNIEVDCLSVGGLGLMERLVGYRQAIILDAIVSPVYPTGALLQFPLQDLPGYGEGHSASVHDISLQQALEMGAKLGADLPESIFVVGIVTNPTFDFGEKLSPPIAAAVARAAAAVRQWLDERLLNGHSAERANCVAKHQEVKP